MSTVTPSQGFPRAEGDEVYDPSKMFGSGDKTLRATSYPASTPEKRKFRTAKDIVIPAGTEVDVDPIGTNRRFLSPHAVVVIAVTKDHTADWTMDLDEAIETGLVELVPEQQGESI